MDTERLQKELRLDPSQLDLAATLQGELFFYWADQLGQARRAMDRAKLAAEFVENDLANRMRRKPDEFLLTKTTEGAVSSAVKVHQEYTESQEHYLELKSQVNLLDAAVTAMEMRKRMIEVLVTLHGQQYFAGPEVPRDLDGAWRSYQEAKSRSLTDRQKLKTRRRKSNEKEST